MSKTDEHFPWSYTGYGVLCACGEPMTQDETCTADQHETEN